jgi:tetratricopeptide (TPR) repeat protein
MSGIDEYGVVREEVLADARERARGLAAEGLPAHEIEHQLDRDLTASERELLWDIAKQAVAAARADAGRVAPVPPPRRERWEDVRRWARTRLDRGWGASIPTVVPVALAAVVGGLLIGLVIASGRDHGAKPSRAQSERVHRGVAGARGPRHPPSRPSASQPRRQSPPAAPSVASGGPGQVGGQTSQPAPASAASLNDRGFQLMNEGRYRDAIPVLRQAVADAGTGGDLTYAYALYNLGRSLRLAGRPSDAIPLLERRLRIDNQRATVARELKAAQRSAHETGGAR